MEWARSPPMGNVSSPPGLSRETALALRNALKLTLSLVATLVVAMVIRFWLPRVLGPEVFGQLHFAESLALGLFLFTTLGADVYIRKEVATRPQHASEFLGGLLVARALASTLVFAGMALTLSLMGKGELEWRLAFLFGIGQVAFVLETTLSALLHAHGTVTALSFVTAGSKLVWGVAIFAGITLGRGPELVALAFAVTEWGKAIVIFLLARRATNLQVRFDLAASLAMLGASLPFFLNFLAHRVYERIDVQMLTVMTNDAEVGFYGAAVNLATAGMLLMPVVSAVILPMGARIAARSREELNEVMKKAVRLIVAFGGLLSVVLALHAEAIIALCFGERFAGSVPGLRVLAPMLPLTYLATIAGMHLIQLGRIWSVTRISVVGLVLNPALNLLAIPWGFRAFGAGGGGLAAATTTVATETLACALMLAALGRDGVDRRLIRTLAETALAAGAALGVHVLLEPLAHWRIPLEIAAYVVVGVLTGALPLAELAGSLGAAVRRRVPPSQPGTVTFRD